MTRPSMKPVKPIVLGVILLLISSLSPVSAFAQANIQQNLDNGSCLQLDATSCDLQNGVIQLNSTITAIINTFSLIVGIVAVVMLIYGGFRYVTSGGDSGNIGNAKNTILYAIVGLVIVAVAQAVVQFVLTKA